MPRPLPKSASVRWHRNCCFFLADVFSRNTFSSSIFLFFYSSFYFYKFNTVFDVQRYIFLCATFFASLKCVLLFALVNFCCNQKDVLYQFQKKKKTEQIIVCALEPSIQKIVIRFCKEVTESYAKSFSDRYLLNNTSTPNHNLLIIAADGTVTIFCCFRHYYRYFIAADQTDAIVNAECFSKLMIVNFFLHPKKFFFY